MGYVSKANAPHVLVEAVESLAAGEQYLSRDIARKKLGVCAIRNRRRRRQLALDARVRGAEAPGAGASPSARSPIKLRRGREDRRQPPVRHQAEARRPKPAGSSSRHAIRLGLPSHRVKAREPAAAGSRLFETTSEARCCSPQSSSARIDHVRVDGFGIVAAQAVGERDHSLVGALSVEHDVEELDGASPAP